MEKHLAAAALLILIGAGCANPAPSAPAQPAPAPTAATETAQTPPPNPDIGTDKDHDGLFYEDEVVKGTDPLKADTDGDGLADGDEIHVFGTDPLKADTDGDGFSDGSELKNGYDPLVAGRKLAPEDIAALKEKFRVNPLHQPTYDTLSGGPILQ